MPQEQKTVRVKLKDGSISKGIATGKNAAWMCVCGRGEPLLGRSDFANRILDGSPVDCPDCRRKYFIVPDGEDQARVSEIVESE